MNADNQINRKKTNRPPRLLVTGGGGFLGGAIVRALIRQGESVRSFSRGFYPDLEALGVEQVQGDLRDAEAVESACSGVETVFHTAAKAGVWGAERSFAATNVDGTRNVIEACRKQGVAQLIYTSSPSVVFDGSDMEGIDESAPYPARYLTHYPRTKAQAERMVRSAADENLKTIAMRPHLIWGPGDNHLVPRIIARARRLRRVGNGRNRVDTIYIDNAADAHLLAAEALRKDASLSGRVYFISQGKPIRLWEMVNAILAAGGLPPVRRSISPRTALCIGAVLEFCYRCLGIRAEPPMTRFVAKELATSHWFDISAARRDLGYAPRVSTEQGLQQLAGWLQTSRQFNDDDRNGRPVQPRLDNPQRRR